MAARRGGPELQAPSRRAGLGEGRDHGALRGEGRGAAARGWRRAGARPQLPRHGLPRRLGSGGGRPEARRTGAAGARGCGADALWRQGRARRRVMGRVGESVLNNCCA
ncbi:hypothetical protein PAHAL_6G068300 [Panicum hallii]|uniref:Uncharacterized protein n=1 Tax=Panicum hallii TaxID=206008 RepID=A0A2T8IFF6_9POAL|nr:hypothetical protein PAHAL_6G068300 [Panicum hallii]